MDRSNGWDNFRAEQRAARISYSIVDPESFLKARRPSFDPWKASCDWKNSCDPGARNVWRDEELRALGGVRFNLETMGPRGYDAKALAEVNRRIEALGSDVHVVGSTLAATIERLLIVSYNRAA